MSSTASPDILIADAYITTSDLEEEDLITELCISILSSHCESYLDKRPKRTSTATATGRDRITELLTSAHPVRIYEVLRMNLEAFQALATFCKEHTELKVSQWVSIEEKLAIFLYISGTSTSNRGARPLKVDILRKAVSSPL
jgi:hypothetical protein